ncbi:hypothetical protein K3495_g7294 [Podosphaera aphanis]|nr:hypothetical protein K3495_g7294 [Podosphaera aphanis]
MTDDTTVHRRLSGPGPRTESLCTVGMDGWWASEARLAVPSMGAPLQRSTRRHLSSHGRLQAVTTRSIPLFTFVGTRSTATLATTSRRPQLKMSRPSAAQAATTKELSAPHGIRPAVTGLISWRSSTALRVQGWMSENSALRVSACGSATDSETMCIASVWPVMTVAPSTVFERQKFIWRNPSRGPSTTLALVTFRLNNKSISMLQYLSGLLALLPTRYSRLRLEP